MWPMDNCRGFSTADAFGDGAAAWSLASATWMGIGQAEVGDDNDCSLSFAATGGEDANRLISSWHPSRMGDRSFRFLELLEQVLIASLSSSCCTTAVEGWGTTAEVSKLDVEDISSVLLGELRGEEHCVSSSMTAPSSSTLGSPVVSEMVLLQAWTNAWQMIMTWPIYPLRNNVLLARGLLLPPCCCCCSGVEESLVVTVKSPDSLSARRLVSSEVMPIIAASPPNS
mmetsp:Transcript_27984/g.50634  ORF Transcript_27984/g.50634 Transcript_27984/m.50634 type:complete len:227 (-) Transcript_27984:1727-2407(-)